MEIEEACSPGEKEEGILQAKAGHQGLQQERNKEAVINASKRSCMDQQYRVMPPYIARRFNSRLLTSEGDKRDAAAIRRRSFGPDLSTPHRLVVSEDDARVPDLLRERRLPDTNISEPVSDRRPQTPKYFGIKRRLSGFCKAFLKCMCPATEEAPPSTSHP